MRCSSYPLAGGSYPDPDPTVAAIQSAPAMPATTAAVVASIVPTAPTHASRRYANRVGPTPPSPPHPRPTRRAPPSKRARTSGLGESSSFRLQEPYSPPNKGPVGDLPLDLSPASIIRRPFFHYDPIAENSDCSTRDLHREVYYDLPTFAADPELIDSMRLVKRYSLEPFLTPRRFFYPRVVIEFYHTMTSKREPNPTAIHFSIDGRPGILRATDIVATFNLPVVVANLTDYKQWPHPSTREMVRLLSRDMTSESILFRRQLPPRMLLIDHILWSNLFPLQHLVQRR